MGRKAGNDTHGKCFSSASHAVLSTCPWIYTTARELNLVKSRTNVLDWQSGRLEVPTRRATGCTQSWFSWLPKSLSRWIQVTCLFWNDLSGIWHRKPWMFILHQTTSLKGERVKSFRFSKCKNFSCKDLLLLLLFLISNKPQNPECSYKTWTLWAY